MFDLTKITTEHPGGFQDIFNTLETAGGKEHRYTVSKTERDPKDPQKVVVKQVQQTVCYGDILAEIKRMLNVTPQISGQIASAITHVLAKYGLPAPGDRRWAQPAAKWLM